MRKILLTLIILITLSGCNVATRNFGGTMTIDLPKGEKLVDVTWKESNLWYLTKSMTDQDVAETYEFKEDSTYGVLEGRVIFKESK